jgi:hypothetical protein
MKPALEKTIEAVEAMNSRIDGVGRGFLVTHVAFDGEYIALAGKGAARHEDR